LKLDHFSFVAALIRDQIDEFDAAIIREQATGDDELLERDAPGSTGEHIDPPPILEPPVADNLSYQRRRVTFEAGAITLRSQQPPLALSYLESLRDQGSIFSNFRARLSTWLTSMFPLYGFSFPLGCTRVEFQGTDKVSTSFGYV
jgi:hypothetical protein